MKIALAIIAIWFLLNALLAWWLAFGRYRKRPFSEYREARQLR